MDNLDLINDKISPYSEGIKKNNRLIIVEKTDKDKFVMLLGDEENNIIHTHNVAEFKDEQSAEEFLKTLSEILGEIGNDYEAW